MSTESPGKDQNLEYLGEIKNKIKVTQMTYYLTYRVLIDAKKTRTQKYHASVP
jgi:hypothetical protein